jgi:hypothetical protein
MTSKKASPESLMIELISTLPDKDIKEIIRSIVVKAIERSWGLGDKVETSFLDYVTSHMEQMLQSGELGKELDQYINGMKKELFDMAHEAICETFVDAVAEKAGGPR